MDYINLNLLPITLDEDVVFDSKYYENTMIKKMDKFHVKGKIFYNLSEDIEVDLQVTGDLYLEDAVTLEEVLYPIDIKIAGNLEDLQDKFSETEENMQNTLDKLEFLWENIVLEVPISYTKSSGVKLQGDGWELNKSSDEDEIDPRLAKLNDLFKGGE